MVEVTSFEPRFLGAVADFYRDIWDPDATPERVARARAEAAAANLVSPGQDIPTFLFVQDGRVIGHLSTIPVRLYSHGLERPAHWFIGFMVRPEHRNGPVGFLLLKEAVRHLTLTLSLTVHPASRRLFASVGFRELGSLPNYLRVLEPARVMARLDLSAIGLGEGRSLFRLGARLAALPGVAAMGGVAVRGAQGLWTWALGRPEGTGRLRAGEGAPKGPELDDLWRRTCPALGIGAVRDAAYLRWRYYATAEGRYRTVTLHEEGRLVGVAMVRVPRAEGDPRLRGIRVATLSDLVFDPGSSGAGLALVEGAERSAHELGADALLASVSHGVVARLLRRRAYIRLPGNLHFLVRDATGALPGGTPLSDWWITRGDMNADEVF